MYCESLAALALRQFHYSLIRAYDEAVSKATRELEEGLEALKDETWKGWKGTTEIGYLALSQFRTNLNTVERMSKKNDLFNEVGITRVFEGLYGLLSILGDREGK